VGLHPFKTEKVVNALCEARRKVRCTRGIDSAVY
jgi:hypothetical protein